MTAFRRSACIAAAGLAACAALAAFACSGSGGTAPGRDRPGPVVHPPPPDLTTPEKAVSSYLERVSVAYRLANSRITTSVITQYEDVRIDSYIQLNKQRNQGIDQQIVALDIIGVRVVEPTATVSAKERWRYRYFALDTQAYTGPEHTASYDSTYTLVREPDRGWVVDSVEATSPVPVP